MLKFHLAADLLSIQEMELKHRESAFCCGAPAVINVFMVDACNQEKNKGLLL